MEQNKYAKILSYRPDIRYKREKVKAQISTLIDRETIVEDFIDNTPISNLIKFNDILSEAKDIMSNLEKLFVDMLYDRYTFPQFSELVKDGKMNTVNQIYNTALNDINSDIVIESYKRINDEFNDVLNFGQLYKFINYGNDDISIKEAENVDISTIERISKYQYESFEKLNYASMNFESKLNKIVELKLELSNIYINTLSSTACGISLEKIESNKEELQKGAKYLFDSVNEEYKQITKYYDEVNSYSNFNKLYKFICGELASYYEMLNLNKSLYDNAGSLTCNEIEKLIDKKASEIDYYILELYKMVAKCSIYIDKYSEMLRKKDEIKRFYKS